MKILCVAFLTLSFCVLAYAGNSSSVPGSDSNIEMGLGGQWRWELSGEKEEDAVQAIIWNSAKDYNSCMERADNKNTADHNRCDKNKAGDACHDKADKQYEDNRASCERVAHSDNLRETGVSYSGGRYKPQGTQDGNGSRYHPHD